MEIVSDLTAKAFIVSLKRFIVRRGMCAQLHVIILELKDLKLMFYGQHTQNKISQFCTADFIEFHHIPLQSPHIGRLWKSAVLLVYHI